MSCHDECVKDSLKKGHLVIESMPDGLYKYCFDCEFASYMCWFNGQKLICKVERNAIVSYIGR